jgi:hypothetical protein
MSEKMIQDLGQTAAAKLGTLWCDMMHDSAMWPIHGQYLCRTCGRSYPVPWAQANWSGSRPPAVRHARAASFGSAVLPLIILAALLVSPVRAGDVPIVEATGGASMAFARYIAGLEQATPWGLETIDIDASLPKLEKQGRLRAIRRLLPIGKPEYQVLEMAGDRTVRQQVIVRYLSAEVRAAALPAASVAVTPANYKFRYKGSIKSADGIAYAFQITPRHKREGLIKGELWVDSETGSAVRLSGYLVKGPSIFVKRVDMIRETSLSDGTPQMRVTHISVDTRLVGRAELTIHERPGAASDSSVAMSVEEP